jgi:hypothetical protein
MGGNYHFCKKKKKVTYSALEKINFPYGALLDVALTINPLKVSDPEIDLRTKVTVDPASTKGLSMSNWYGTEVA